MLTRQRFPWMETGVAVVMICAVLGTAFLISGTAEGADGETARVMGSSRPLGYLTDKQDGTFYRSGIAVVDSSQNTEWAAIPKFRVGGRQNVPMTVWFNSSTGSATITAGYFRERAAAQGGDVFLSAAEIVVAAGTILDSRDKHAGFTGFDGRGASYIKFVVTVLSAGENVDLQPGSF